MRRPLIDVAGNRFVDADGRQMILRGVNLGGDCKVPWPDGGTHLPGDFADHRAVSFVNRPFPLEEADAHLARIAGWGFNILRLLVTWEAIEHRGPGDFDHAYLDYVAGVCRAAARHGLLIFIDFHQDVWSRMTGGDGAPGWLFARLGLDFTRFDAAGAAHVMQHRYDYARAEARQEDRYPMMSWSRNYRLPANGIVWTAFFAGAALTPGWQIDGVDVQTFLRRHYLGAMAALAARLADIPEVIGFDTLNEPSPGWIGQPMSALQLAATREAPIPVRAGPAWTPFAALQAAGGSRVELPVLAPGPDGAMRIVGRETANADGVPIWLPGTPDPFAAAGAWNGSARDPQVLDEDFFRRLDPDEALMCPFFHDVAETIRTVRADWLLFAEMNPYQFAYGRGFPADMPARSVNASHWYDVDILWRKRFDAGVDRATLRERYRSEIAGLHAASDPRGAMPRLLGEFGIPYDLDQGAAYAAWANGARGESLWDGHAVALGLMYDALDALLISATQWNYTATNRNDPRIGDGWNQEDLSIWSSDQQAGGADGARARKGFSRPYVERAQGAIVAMQFDSDSARFEAEIDIDPTIAAPSVIVVPETCFPGGPIVTTDPGARWWHVEPAHRLCVAARRAGRLRVTIEPAVERRPTAAAR